ncbi:MAG: AMP-dependent synthetase [Chloroflexi bacterium RBG_13_56_8]|nr:MAG: AMP-dependent synthetase [Chloroflexi bacterium RBG_13_56_8]
MLVQDFLENSARLSPNKEALIFGQQRLAYQQIDAMANRLANAFLAAGVQRGDRIAIYLGNSVETVVALFAALKADAIFTIINPSTKAEKLRFLLNNCRASALVAHARTHSILHSVCPQVPSLRYLVTVGSLPRPIGDSSLSIDTFRAIQNHSPAHQPPARAIDADLAALIYTSGSTGLPKGVMCTHLNMTSVATSVITYLENVAQDIIINVLPLSFSYGLYQVLMAFQIGATLVLEPGFAYPYAILNRMAEEKVTGFPGVPTMFATLLELNDVEKFKLPHLRYITNAGAALPVEHIRRLREAFPAAALYSMYGLTECKRVSYLPPSELDRRPSSVGIPIPNSEVWIVDENDQRVGPGVVGELVVRGSHVMQGYWDNPIETAKSYRPGPLPGERVLYTGDLFTMDEEGFLYFVARKDDIIKCRGEKVSPKEVENVLYSLPEVAETAVIGVPDPVLGQAIKAFIILRNGKPLDSEDIIHYCRRHLEDFMVPSQVEFRTELPKTDSGKIRKASLR